PVLQAHLEHRVRERGHNLTLDLDGILFYQALRTLNLLLKRRCVGHSERPPLRATRNGEYTREPREAQGGCPAARPVPGGVAQPWAAVSSSTALRARNADRYESGDGAASVPRSCQPLTAGT